MTLAVTVIPCFNEAGRFAQSEAQQLLDLNSHRLLLVNDGSTDQTLQVLQQFASQHSDRVEVLDLAQNQGKAEAVRRGMLEAIAAGATEVGFLDADFATPATEMLRLYDVLQNKPETQVLLGARWLRLGAEIERSILRHYAGRVFATLASQVLKLKVYDTQCGAKWFRVNDALQASLTEPFVSPWAFDVELIGRLRQHLNQSDFYEEPLKCWTDVAGSKITLFEMIQATLALYSIHRALRRRAYSNDLGAHHGKNSGIS